MKSRPILFSAPMVRALLDGSKTQTRRVVKPQPDCIKAGQPYTTAGLPSTPISSPFGQVGDQLWVRETWGVLHEHFIDSPLEPTFWRADYSDADLAEQKAGTLWLPRWRSSIHMFRNRSRITLEITNVRVERLQDISEADCIAEGIEKTNNEFWSTYGAADVDGTYSPKTSYRRLWESINGPGSWDLNPWVWVIEFKKVAA